MDNLNSKIGVKVISASFGEGIISEITEMNKEPFFIVLNQANNMKHYVPINDSNAYRFISTEDLFLITLKEHLIDFNQNQKFASKKDRINFYKEQSKNQKLTNVCQNIKTLHLTEDKGSLEDQIYQRLIENISLEYSIIKKIKNDEALEFVENLLKNLN